MWLPRWYFQYTPIVEDGADKLKSLGCFAISSFLQIELDELAVGHCSNRGDQELCCLN
jgi:hypothetical protein